MLIKIITCHNVYNYGASLQAYALMKFLEQHGYSVEIIDYRPDYLSKRYNLFRFVKKGTIYNFYRHFPFFKPLWALLQNRKDLKFWGRKRKFDYFTKHSLKLTSYTYRTIDDFKNNPILANLFIAGSDQIWNTNCPNGLDENFYCSFSKNVEKNISYAASFATASIAVEHLNFVKSQLSNFRTISVREKTGVELAHSLGYEATLVVDPVFLQPKKYWDKLCNKNYCEKYLLVYDFLNNDDNLRNCALFLAKKYDLKIYSVNDYGEISFADVNINSAGPIDFLELIRNASYVVSSSFHATAFSVIFKKNFITFPLKNYGNSSRIRDFLNIVQIKNRFIASFDELTFEETQIEYDKVEYLLEEYAEKSKKWLLEEISKGV